MGNSELKNPRFIQFNNSLISIEHIRGIHLKDLTVEIHDEQNNICCKYKTRELAEESFVSFGKHLSVIGSIG